ncbi:O-methyltransferase [Nitrosarchaeum sp.]|uniref:O-methyltransferase n=1 Tax=Nitrosarchaeum sp. TaxID=2026886 RepID=UPI00247EEB32|nr:O-methyltransferase [Nitrosarchaeum sp.]MCV0411761.1 O-methyltransferase [Nitrosarchaeum sp.]
MDKKIARVLHSLEKRSKYEEKNYKKISHDQRILAITKDTGIFYNILLKTHKPKKILEIGTSFGYSTLWFANAIIGKNSKIITIEQNPYKINIAQKNFRKAGVSKMIEIKEGTAKNVLLELKKSVKSNSKNYFDFVFIDADKELYSIYFDICLSMLKKDGIIAADNILYPIRFKKYIKKYLNHIHGIPSIESITVPIGNGQEISFKTK